MSRVRLIVTDDHDHAPEETQVLFRQRLGWVALLGAYLAVLCLPAHRALVTDQAQRVVTHRTTGWMRAANGEPGSAQSALLAEARKHPQERDLQLGAVLLRATPEQVAEPPNQPIPNDFTAGIRSEPRVRAAEAIHARFPDDPVVTAQLIRYAWLHGSIRRRTLGDQIDGVPLSPADLERLEQWCREGIRQDPDNGFFPTMLAGARFAAGKDEEALTTLHEASVCGTWKDYAYFEGSGARALLIRTFGDRGLSMHALAMASVLLPHLQNVRQGARLAVWHAEQSKDRETEHRLRADVIRLGSLIRRNGDTLIARLVGAAAEHFGFGDGSTQERGAFRKEEQARKHAAARRSYVARLQHEAPQFAAEVERESRLLDRFEEVKAWYLADSLPFKSWDNLLGGDVRRDVLGLTLLPNLGVALLLWAAAALLAAAPWPQSHRELSAGRWLLSEAPIAARIALIAGLALPLLFGLGRAWVAGGSHLPLAGAVVAVGLALALPYSGRKVEGGWAPATLGVALTLAALAFVPAALASQPEAWWRGQVPSLLILGGEQLQPGFQNATEAFWLPTGALLAAVIPTSVLLIAALRRRTTWQAVNGIRLAFKVSAAILATLYLGYVLFATPATARDARTWDTIIAREAGGDPL